MAYAVVEFKTPDINQILATPEWKGYSSRGADMGRGTWLNEDSYSKPCHLQRLRYVSGDYDTGGAYWGGGNGFIYCAFNVETNTYLFTRAHSRESAKGLLIERFPGLRFFR